MTASLQLVLKEASRRQLLVSLIDRIILDRLERKTDCHTRIKRGQVHELVADALSCRVNSRIRTLVNERMEALGYPLSILHGAKFYRFARMRE